MLKHEGVTKIPAKPRRTQAERRGESTERLLNAALDLLGERRSLDFSLAQVADRANLSRGMPTHIFGTRDEMLRQLVPHLHVRSSLIFGAPEDRGTGLEAILKTAEALLDDRQEQAHIIIAVHVLLAEGVAAESPLHDAVLQFNNAATSFIGRNLELAVANNEIRALTCTQSVSMIVMAMIRGSLLQLLVDPSATSIETLRRELLAMLQALFAPERTVVLPDDDLLF